MILGFTNFVSFIHLTCFCKIIFYSKVLSTLSSSLIFQEHSGILSFSTFQVAIRFAHYCISNLSADLYEKVPNVMNPLSCTIISSKIFNMHLTNNTSKVDIYILKIWHITCDLPKYLYTLSYRTTKVFIKKDKNRAQKSSVEGYLNIQGTIIFKCFN